MCTWEVGIWFPYLWLKNKYLYLVKNAHISSFVKILFFKYMQNVKMIIFVQQKCSTYITGKALFNKEHLPTYFKELLKIWPQNCLYKIAESTIILLVLQIAYSSNQIFLI